ncbi:MAG TPA: site-specific integrase [Kineosporiaceae bacterium]|nr:site-specific integrase [Kineosporiaceae bacterium]
MARKREPGTRAPNNTSSIYQGADGRWHGRVTMGVREDGRPDRRHVSASTEAEVIRKVRRLEKDRDSGNVRKPGQRWTVATWLTHWLTNITEPHVRRSTFEYYKGAVTLYLIPRVGAHRLDRFTADYIEKLYVRLRADGIGAATVQQVHRTLRAALNEAARRQEIPRSPFEFVKAPPYEEKEIEAFTLAEARKIMRVAGKRTNGVRFIVALSLGLRKGEALGLWWSDIDFRAGTLTIRRGLQRHVWRHGCDQAKPCGRKRGADCPKRHGGGLTVVPTKSKAGVRVLDLPGPLLAMLKEHKEWQNAARESIGDMWQDGEWVFATPVGRPIDPSDDHEEWKALLKAAGVRDARLHDARHTAATMLLILKVPTRAVMGVMGWSQASMVKRYQHIPDEVREEIARQQAGLFWNRDEGDPPPEIPVSA